MQFNRNPTETGPANTERRQVRVFLPEDSFIHRKAVLNLYCKEPVKALQELNVVVMSSMPSNWRGSLRLHLRSFSSWSVTLREVSSSSDSQGGMHKDLPIPILSSEVFSEEIERAPPRDRILAIVLLFANDPTLLLTCKSIPICLAIVSRFRNQLLSFLQHYLQNQDVL